MNAIGMREINWMLASLILLMTRKASCWSPSDRSSVRSSCIDLVARHHFRLNSTITVLTSDFYNVQPTTLYSSAVAQDSLVQLLSVGTQFSLVTIKPNGNNRYCSESLRGERPADYFIFVGSTKNVLRSIRTFCYSKLTNDRTHFVVYLEAEEMDEDARGIVQDTLEKFWEHHQQNVAVLVESKPGDIDIYTWFPLDVTPEVKVLDHCNGRSFRDNTPLFPPKVPHDLNGKVVNIGIVVAPIATCDRIGGGYAGLEVELMQAMASALNFTAVYYPSSALARENDSQLVYWPDDLAPWKTILLRMLSGEVNAGIGGFILWTKRFNDFDYTQPFARDTFTFYATDDFLLSGDTERWIGIMTAQMIMVHIFTTFAMHQLERRDLRRNDNLGRTAITVWAVLTDLPVSFSNVSSRQQLLWVVVFYYALNINAAYKSLVTSLLASPKHTQRIVTVTDLIASDLPIMVSSGLPEAVISSVLSLDEHTKLRERLRFCSDPIQTCLVKFISVPKYCLAAFSGAMDFLEYALPSRNFHSLDRTIRTSYLGIYTTKNFYLTRKISMMILRSFQAGLVDLWSRSTLKNKKICDLHDPDWMLLHTAEANRLVSENFCNDLICPFTMTDLYSAFALLGLGLFLAGLVGVFEILSATPAFRSLCIRSNRFCQALRNRRLRRTIFMSVTETGEI